MAVTARHESPPIWHALDVAHADAVGADAKVGRVEREVTANRVAQAEKDEGRRRADDKQVGDGVNENVGLGRNETNVENEFRLRIVAGEVGRLLERPEEELVVDGHPGAIDFGEDTHEALMSEGCSVQENRSRVQS